MFTLTADQIKDLKQLLKIEAGRLGGRPDTDFIARKYDGTRRWCMARRLDLLDLLGPRCSPRLSLRRRPRWPRARRAR